MSPNKEVAPAQVDANCYLCKIKFESDANLERHTKTVHLRMYVCPRCPDFSSLIKYRMSRHFQTVHYVDFKTSENMASIDESPKQVEKPKPASAKARERPVKANAKASSPSVAIGEKDLKLDYNTKDIPEAQPVVNISSSETNRANETNEDTVSMDISTLADVSLSSSIVGAIQGEEVLQTANVDQEVVASKSSADPDKNMIEYESDEMRNRDEVKPSKTIAQSEAGKSLTSSAPNPDVSTAIFSSLCLLCDFETEKLEDLSIHMSEKGHFAPDKTVICPHCPYMPISSEDLLEHGKSHFELFALYQYQCSRCANKFANLIKMEEHWSSAHVNLNNIKM